MSTTFSAGPDDDSSKSEFLDLIEAEQELFLKQLEGCNSGKGSPSPIDVLEEREKTFMKRADSVHFEDTQTEQTNEAQESGPLSPTSQSERKRKLAETTSDSVVVP